MATPSSATLIIMPEAGPELPSPGDRVTSSPSASPAAPTDPLLDSSAPFDCGQPLPNPHGFLHDFERRDGSCKACEEAPPKQARCTPSERTQVTPQNDLSGQHGKLVRLQGRVTLQALMCTRRGGRCGCNNRCSAPLLLTRSTESASKIPLVSQGQMLGCGGDEGSVCCPLELDRSSRSRRVIASGIWVDPRKKAASDDGPEEPHLESVTLCRLE